MKVMVSEVRERAERVAALMMLPWINAEEAAEVAQVHPSTVRRACRDGRLKAVRLDGGRRFRLSPRSLRKWMERG